MITEIDENALVTSETLKVMEGYVMPEGRLYVEDSIFELKRMRYRIRDYRDVYDIAENEFEMNPQRKVNLKTCVKEIKQAV
jgi:outer membrane lipoprotein-sorting protein